MATLEPSHREVSDNVSFEFGVLFVVEQWSFDKSFQGV